MGSPVPSSAPSMRSEHSLVVVSVGLVLSLHPFDWSVSGTDVSASLCLVNTASCARSSFRLSFITTANLPFP